MFGERTFNKETERYGEYEWKTYSEIKDRVTNIARGLKSIYLELDLKELIGIYSINRIEWCITDFAASFFSIIVVALFDTYGQDSLEYVINHSSLPLIVCSYDKIENLLVNPIESLKVIICMDEIDISRSETILKNASAKDIKLYTFSELERLGMVNEFKFQPPHHDQVYTYCYTSGSTGSPQGAILSHLAFSTSSLSISLALDNNDVSTYL